MEKILECIKKYDTIIIHGHIRPDGDCIGSQYGQERIGFAKKKKELYKQEKRTK